MTHFIIELRQLIALSQFQPLEQRTLALTLSNA